MAKALVACVDMHVLTRNNVTLSGQDDGQLMIFAHGYSGGRRPEAAP